MPVSGAREAPVAPVLGLFVVGDFHVLAGSSFKISLVYRVLFGALKAVRGSNPDGMGWGEGEPKPITLSKGRLDWHAGASFISPLLFHSLFFSTFSERLERILGFK